MYCPAEVYVNENDLQHTDCEKILNNYVDRMTWTPDEIVLDVGCGPGDVTTNVLLHFLQDKIKRLVGVDKSRVMIEHAKSTHVGHNVDFEILDIQNAKDCASFYSYNFDKIFSFYCFHWINNQYDALVNMHSMLKNGGEILAHYLFEFPSHRHYKHLDPEWKKYTDKVIQHRTSCVGSEKEVRAIFVKAGFRIITTELAMWDYVFKDLSSYLDFAKLFDETYNVLPADLHDKYFRSLRDKLTEKKLVDICPDTGKTTFKYHCITVHAIKDLSQPGA